MESKAEGGVGLALCKSAVEAHGGTISARAGTKLERYLDLYCQYNLERPPVLATSLIQLISPASIIESSNNKECTGRAFSWLRRWPVK